MERPASFPIFRSVNHAILVMDEADIRLTPQKRRELAIMAARTGLLARSVGWLTSCDVQPCLEYRDEIANEHAVIDRLLYVQEYRNSLERCIGSEAACLRYR